MKKYGFTLTELLGVIVLIGILLVLAFPPIVNHIKRSTEDIDKATRELIYNSTDFYLEKNQQNYPLNNGSVFCISLKTLVDNGELSKDLTNVNNGKKIDLNKVVKVNYETNTNVDYNIVKENECVEKITKPFYVDKTGANRPSLNSGMIPVVWDATKWVKADIYDKWYDYKVQEWANVVLVNETTRNDYLSAKPQTEIKEEDILAHLVWIPRYKYKLFNVDSEVSSPREIEIIFEKKQSPKSNGNINGTYLTHPAFTFGEELSGFWIGKFELTGTSTEPSIKPNYPSLKEQTVSAFFEISKLFNNETVYGLPANTDAHMIKNMEWGAVTYLSHSKYGRTEEITINDNISFLTGDGDYIINTNQSATGNIYGVYDMNGGSFEYVMGGMFDSGDVTISVSSSGFDQVAIDSASMSKYIDKYAYGNTYNDQSAYDRRKLGDATGETRGWYSDSSHFVYSTSSWFERGGYNNGGITSGPFQFNRIAGGSGVDDSSRLVIPGF
ncbi:MAG: type II secretion system protein [Bacilli bacterium]|nr:type II secretion system protein [Bacilli bacterium]